MRKRWIITLGAVAFGGAIISQMPLSWLGPKVDIGGKTPIYSGTIWNGFVSGTDAGVLKLETSLMRLITGKNPVHISGGPAGLSLSAEAGPSGLRALKVQGTLKALALRDPRLALVDGNFAIDVPDMKIMESCDYANGTVTTDFLAQNYDRLRWKGPVLEGPVSCEDGLIYMDLAGQDSAADIVAKIMIDLRGQYSTDITAKVASPEAGLALEYFGFQKSGTGYKLMEQGRW